MATAASFSAVTFRLTYRVNKQRYAKTFHGTEAEAKKELRALLRSGDTGTHVVPTRMTLTEWAEHWLSIGCPGRKKRRVGRRSLERYQQLMRGHVIPELGAKRLQQIHATEIDRLYEGLEGKLAPRTQNQVHTMFAACLNAAVRKALLSVSPMERAEKIPSPKAITVKSWTRNRSRRWCNTSRAAPFTALLRLPRSLARGAMKFLACNGPILIRSRKRYALNGPKGEAGTGSDAEAKGAQASSPQAHNPD